jgi:DNA-binding LacI/PurR family transcriptional regulator
VTAAEKLLQRINAPKNTDFAKHIVVEPELIVRGTTGRVV